MKTPEEIIQAIREAGNVALFTHVHPDGDALGSLLGFAGILEGMGKSVFCYLEDSVPYLYDFLPGCYRVSTSFDQLSSFIEEKKDIIAISLDCGDCDRLGTYRDRILAIEPFLVIDHHQSHRDFGRYRWVDSQKSSTGEMVFELAEQLGADIPYEAAYNLYVAISTDTGSFCYESTSARTLRIAANLVDRGVLPEEVSGRIYNNYTPERLRLMQLVLETLRLYDEKQIAMIHVTQDMFNVSGALPEDVEGFVDFPRSINSVKVAAFCKEGKNGIISVSLRAKGECDVAEVARDFQGGGHRNAAGFRLSGKSVDQVCRIVKEELYRALH